MADFGFLNSSLYPEGGTFMENMLKRMKEEREWKMIGEVNPKVSSDYDGVPQHPSDVNLQ
jgi:hypothetical protein